MWKIKLPHIVFGFLSLLALPFILSSGSVSASSYSLTLDANSDLSSDILIYQDVNATMSGTPLLNFAPVYVEIQQSGYNGYYHYCGSNGYGILATAQGSGYNLSGVACIDSFIDSIFDFTRVWSISSHDYILLIKPSQFSGQISWMSGYTITYTFYDSLPSFDCPDCPPIPDNPYDDKLDSINRSILIVSATALVIYFFYAIYSMFFGGIR